LFETSLLTSGFGLDDPTHFGNRIHKMIKLGLSIEDNNIDQEEDLPSLEKEAEDSGVKSKMEEVD
jgi:molecular chaperone HtpG